MERMVLSSVVGCGESEVGDAEVVRCSTAVEEIEVFVPLREEQPLVADGRSCDEVNMVLDRDRVHVEGLPGFEHIPTGLWSLAAAVRFWVVPYSGPCQHRSHQTRAV